MLGECNFDCAAAVFMSIPPFTTRTMHPRYQLHHRGVGTIRDGAPGLYCHPIQITALERVIAATIVSVARPALSFSGANGVAITLEKGLLLRSASGTTSCREPLRCWVSDGQTYQRREPPYRKSDRAVVSVEDSKRLHR